MGNRSRLIRSPRDAEYAVRDWLRAHGYGDAEVTPQGPDAGVDVVSRQVVAQVKAEMVPTGRPVLQAIFGIAAHSGKRAALFTLAGATAQAMEFAQEVGVAVFRFDLQGQARPQNSAARELENMHGAAHVVSRVPLSQAGRRIVEHIDSTRRSFRNTIVSGFAPDTDPLHGFRRSPTRDEFGVTRNLAERLFKPAEQEFDSLMSGAITLNVRWFDPFPHSSEDPVDPVEHSAFDPNAYWEGETSEATQDPDVWSFPIIDFYVAHDGDNGGWEHIELQKRLSRVRQRHSMIRAFGGTEGEWGNYFDLRLSGNAVRAVEYAEALLREVGSSMERLFWWAYPLDLSVDGQAGQISVDWDGSVRVASETPVSQVVTEVGRARLWPLGDIEVASPEPPESVVLRMPRGWSDQSVDLALDLLGQLEELGVRIEFK